MKSLKLIALFTLLFGYVAMMSCGSGGHSHDQTEQHDHDGADHDHDHDHDEADHDHDGDDHSDAAHGSSAEYTSAYVCPMHCEKSGSDQAGKCPVCGMDYVALAEHTKDGHKH